MSQTRIAIPSYFLPFFGFLAAIVPFAIDAYLPAFPMMAREFGVSESTIGLSISFFLLGYGLGQFIGGPLSDQVGRKPIALSGMSLLLLATLGIIFSTSLQMVMYLRFIQAIGGGFTTVIVMASMRDAYPAHEAGRKYSIAMMIMLIMPIVAPMIGARLLPYGWKSIFLALFVFVCLAFLAYLFGIRETAAHRTGKIDFLRIYQQFKGVIQKKNKEGRRPIMYVFAVACNVGMLLAFVTNSSAIYQGIFGVCEEHFPYYFGANSVLMIVCISYSVRRMKVKNPHRLFIVGNLINLACTTSLFIYSYFFVPQLIPSTVLIVISIGTLGLVNPCASAVYISNYDELSGSATSFNRLVVLMSGGLAGALVAQLSDGSLLPFAIIALICVLASNIIGWTIPAPAWDFKSKE